MTAMDIALSRRTIEGDTAIAANPRSLGYGR